jgi:hypothetical protein
MHDHTHLVPPLALSTFKAYYTEHVQAHLRAEFPTLVSYQRFAS